MRAAGKDVNIVCSRKFISGDFQEVMESRSYIREVKSQKSEERKEKKSTGRCAFAVALLSCLMDVFFFLYVPFSHIFLAT